MTYAHDDRLHRYVALKISIADTEAQDPELRILKSLRDLPSSSGFQHIERLLDDFRHTGPNGTHSCLILELFGPSVPTVVEAHYHDGRLPGIIANRVMMQVVLALDFLHRNRIGHGGIDTLSPAISTHLLLKLSNYSNSADMFRPTYRERCVRIAIPGVDVRRGSH